MPDIDTDIGLMHTFFALEDIYGLKIGEIDGEPCLRLDKSDEWHYKYPDLDTRQIWAKVPPQELFDFINRISNETGIIEKKEAKTRKMRPHSLPFPGSSLDRKLPNKPALRIEMLALLLVFLQP